MRNDTARITGSITDPHPDLELGAERTVVPYVLDMPSSGMTPNTGLLFYIHGYGARFDDDYARKLGPFLADKYDCVVARVDYFGAVCHSGGDFVPAPDFFLKLKEHFGLQLSVPPGTPILTVVEAALDALRGRGVTELPPDTCLVQQQQYNSFGLLPALDHLQVMHRVLCDLPVNRRRLFAIGTSYGGYIALLLNKLAPNTFRLLVDNSGFTSPDDAKSSLYGVMAGNVCGVRFYARNLMAFSPSPGTAGYFGPARESLRELRVPAHYAASDTAIQCFHSQTDTVARPERKVELGRLLQTVRKCEVTLIGPADLDGHCFKNLEHGMQASMRGLFGLAYERWLPFAASAPAVTDFELGTVLPLACADQTYTLLFDPRRGVELSIA